MRFKGLFLLFVVGCAIFDKSQGDQYCGIKRMPIGTIVGGMKVHRQVEWPWLVAFFNKVNGNFFCSGTLISEKHVLSGK